MTVLADVYTAIHHVIKPLTLIADGSKVNSRVQELEHEECIHWEQGRWCNSCSISRWPSVMTGWCSSAWREKWTLWEPESIEFSLPCPVWWAVRCPLLPAAQEVQALSAHCLGDVAMCPWLRPRELPGTALPAGTATALCVNGQSFLQDLPCS